MSLLDRLESALERLAEGGAERVFGGQLDLVAIGQELCNAAVETSRPAAEGPIAPNSYEVRLSLADFGHLADQAEELQRRYAAALWRRLRDAGYGSAGPPTVLVTPLEAVPRGAFEVQVQFREAPAGFTLSNLDESAGVYRLTEPTVIGRDAGCDLCLADGSVSRRHARIAWERNDFVVEDLGSTNGVEVNGVRVSRSALHAGDVLMIGDVLLRFTVESGTPTEHQP